MKFTIKIMRNKFFIMYALVLVALAALGYTMGDYAAQSQKVKAAVAEVESSHFMSDVAFMALPSIEMTTMPSHGSPGQLRLDLSLEVEKKDMPRMKAFTPVITERLANYIRTLDADELRQKNSILHLRQDLLGEANASNPSRAVLDIVVRQFIVL